MFNTAPGPPPAAAEESGSVLRWALSALLLLSRSGGFGPSRAGKLYFPFGGWLLHPLSAATGIRGALEVAGLTSLLAARRDCRYRSRATPWASVRGVSAGGHLGSASSQSLPKASIATCENHSMASFRRDALILFRRSASPGWPRPRFLNTWHRPSRHPQPPSSRFSS